MAGAGLVAVLVVVVLVLVLSGGDGDDGGPRLRVTGDTRGIPDASPVGRLGGRAALVRLKREMRPGDDLSTVSLTSFHAVADLGTAGGGGRTLAIKDVPDGRVDVDEDSGGPIDPGVPITRLDPDAPGRLLAAVLRGLGPDVRPRILEMRAVASIGPRPDLEWQLDVAGPDATRRWTGDEHGRHVVRRSDGTPAPPEGSPGPALRPTGVNASSLLRPANLRAQLDAVAARPDAQGGVSSVGIAPKVMTVSLVQFLGSPDSQGRERLRTRIFTVDAAGGIEVAEVLRRERRDERGVGVPIASIDPEAPLRALRTIGRRDDRDAGAAVRTVQFLAADAFTGAPTGWELEIDDGKHLATWSARPDGRGVRR